MKIKNKDPFFIRFLYKTAFGRTCLKALIQPRFSRCAACLLDSSVSKWIIPFYIRLHHISMGTYVSESYSSFNHFFTRKREDAFLNIDRNPLHFISPCDGYLSVFPIEKRSKFRVKYLDYSLESLLHDSLLAAEYIDGLCLIFRLEPHHYHRYCYPDSGQKIKHVSIPGRLHSVRPAALATCPVFLENSREYTLVVSENFGRLVQMEVGALMVGKIQNHKGHIRVERGMEKGYFAFGGSTIILLVKKGILNLSPSIAQAMLDGKETAVVYGEQIGNLKYIAF